MKVTMVATIIRKSGKVRGVCAFGVAWVSVDQEKFMPNQHHKYKADLNERFVKIIHCSCLNLILYLNIAWKSNF